jgi:protein-S-isoprenylcysteine O-methyltransferase Ste14
MLQRFGQDTFAEKKRLTCLAADDLTLFRSVNRRRGSPEMNRLIARARLIVIRDLLVLLIYLQAVGCRRFPVSGAVVAYFLLLSSFILLAFFQMIAVGQLDSVRSAKNAQPI